MPTSNETADGLPVKEGIVLDQTEQVVLYSSENSREANQTRSAKGSFNIPFFLLPLISIGVLATFVFGAFIIGGVAVFLAVFLVFQLLFSRLRSFVR